MTRVDQFESVFRAASKPVYRHRPVAARRVALVTDLPEDEASALAGRLGAFLPAARDAEWLAVPGARSETVEGLLDVVAAEGPDLVATYRNLHTAAWRWPHSLGRHLDVLTQATRCPVLVIPHPGDGAVLDAALAGCQTVMAVTDHLAGESRLVDHAVACTPAGGSLFLAHIEDDRTFERYMDAISKIPTIDTDDARERLAEQLLREPRDYIGSCARALEEAGVDVRVETVVRTGHRLAEYRALVAEHDVDLVVMNTKDEDQLAMHGLAYPLAVELRDRVLLMI